MRYRARYRHDHLGLIADGRLDGDLEIRKTPTDLGGELWQVILHMSAHAEEHRHHPQAAHAFAMERRGACRQRRLHQFQEGKHYALAGQQLAEFGYEMLERARPLRVARTVGEEDECSFGHGAIIFEAAASR